MSKHLIQAQILLAFPKNLSDWWLLPSTSKALSVVTGHHHILPELNRLFICLLNTPVSDRSIEMYVNEIIPILCLKDFNGFPSLSRKTPKSLKMVYKVTWTDLVLTSRLYLLPSLPHSFHLRHTSFLAVCSNTIRTLQATLGACCSFCLKKSPSDSFKISFLTFFRPLFKYHLIREAFANSDKISTSFLLLHCNW